MSGYFYNTDSLESEIEQSIIRNKKRQTPTIEDRLLCRVTPIIDSEPIIIMNAEDYRKYVEGKK